MIPKTIQNRIHEVEMYGRIAKWRRPKGKFEKLWAPYPYYIKISVMKILKLLKMLITSFVQVQYLIKIFDKNNLTI